MFQKQFADVKPRQHAWNVWKDPAAKRRFLCGVHHDETLKWHGHVPGV